MKTIRYYDAISESYINIEVDDEVATTLEAFEAEDKQDEIAFCKAVKSAERPWYFRGYTEDDYVGDVIEEFLADNDIEELKKMTDDSFKVLVEYLFPDVDPINLQDASEVYANRRKTWETTYIDEFIPRKVEKDVMWNLSHRTNKACRDAIRYADDSSELFEIEFSYDMQTSHDVPRYDQYEDNTFGLTEYVYSQKFRESAKEGYASRTWTGGQKNLVREKRRAEYQGFTIPPRFIRLDSEDKIIRKKYYTWDEFNKGEAMLKKRARDERAMRVHGMNNSKLEDRDFEAFIKMMQVIKKKGEDK